MVCSNIHSACYSPKHVMLLFFKVRWMSSARAVQPGADHKSPRHVMICEMVGS